jgi:hypothetical protein
MGVQYPSGTVWYRYHDHAIGSAISRVGSVSIHRSESPRPVSVRDVLKIHFLKNLSSLLLKGSHRLRQNPLFADTVVAVISTAAARIGADYKNGLHRSEPFNAASDSYSRGSY